MGAVSSAILLLGIAFVYGAVGEVSFASLTAAISTGSPSLLLVTGLVLVVVGILFKVGAVPFHVWIPDVYQGAPSPVVAFLSTGSKLAGHGAAAAPRSGRLRALGCRAATACSGSGSSAGSRP